MGKHGDGKPVEITKTLREKYGKCFKKCINIMRENIRPK